MQYNLVKWYQANHRNLPWRQTKDPYHIWISEIMLQQTRVETVIPYYIRFFEAFPTIDLLAHASLDELYNIWQGLGYYSRIRNIQKAAIQIIDEYHGIFPSTSKELAKLKGIGPYTSRAISSIAFNHHEAAIDGNALRIISRVFEINGNIQDSNTVKQIQEISDKLIADVDPSEYNQAIMDLGSGICHPKNPDCPHCPIQSFCQAYTHNTITHYPINIKNIKIKKEKSIAGIIKNKASYFLIKKEEGLLSNLYATPQYFVETPELFIQKFQEEYEIPIAGGQYLGHVKHVFTHRIWEIEVYYFTTQVNSQDFYLDYSLLPISTCHLKVLALEKKKE